MGTFKEYINEGYKTIKIDPSKIDASKIKDGMSYVDLEDMYRFGNMKEGVYYEVGTKLYLYKKDTVFFVHDIEARYNWSTHSYSVAYREHLVPPKEVVKKVKGKTITDKVTKLPMVFFHGTDADFQTFSDEFAGTTFGGMNEFRGHYFSQRKDYAKGFGDNLHQACLMIKKPVYNYDKRKLHQEWIDDTEDNTSNWQDWLISKGYDAIVHIDSNGKDIFELVVFSSKQIIKF
jgi:hypothetical protein